MARPVKTPFTHQEIGQIETLSGIGLNVAKISYVLGISKKTFERRLKYSPGGPDALEKGRAVAEKCVTQTLYQMATSGKVPAATFFWLKCRARWSEGEFIKVEQINTKSEDSKALEELRAQNRALLQAIKERK